MYERNQTYWRYNPFFMGDLHQRSRPAFVSEKKKKELVDEGATAVLYVQDGRLLAYAYDPRDICGTCRHDVLGSKMSTSGTRGLGFPVGCASDQARRWYHRRLCTASRIPAAVSIPAIPEPRVVKLTRTSVLDPTS